MRDLSPEQRARDVRLAWIIVAGSAVVTLGLVTWLATTLIGPAAHTLERGWREGLAASTARPQAAIPPDTARPLGSPALWINSTNYPDAALARGERGVVRVTLAIGVDGVATGCSVALSSGYAGLDNGTCLALMKAGRFAPAEPSEAGTAPGEVRRWTSPPVVWDASGGTMLLPSTPAGG